MTSLKKDHFLVLSVSINALIPISVIKTCKNYTCVAELHLIHGDKPVSGVKIVTLDSKKKTFSLNPITPIVIYGDT